jgi:hypothetical protein
MGYDVVWVWINLVIVFVVKHSRDILEMNLEVADLAGGGGGGGGGGGRGDTATYTYLEQK